MSTVEEQKGEQLADITEDDDTEEYENQDRWSDEQVCGSSDGGQEIDPELIALSQEIMESIGRPMGVLCKKSNYEPISMSPEDASELLSYKTNIMILTGAGLSAASSIPTFRGNDGLWTKKYKHCETPEELATLKFFKAHPEVKWQCIHDFYELCKNAEPNAGHKAIVQFQEYCKLNGKQCHLVTQNIDDLHARLIRESEILKPTVTSEGEPGFGFTDSVYEIHGNLSYSRCSQECSKALKPVQVPDKELSLEDQIPKCEECKSIMRPHVLWFDECYTQELHKVQTVKNIINSKVDALIIVGTALATTMANRLVNECLSRKILTINMNLEPCCDFGPVVEILGKSEETLPKLFQPFIPVVTKCKTEEQKNPRKAFSQERSSHSNSHTLLSPTPSPPPLSPKASHSDLQISSIPKSP
ncbi:unnamed protein product [Moneuplotes crassus]|uniref:Deacetylase sirtuin-type domain-containing protein n=1 Tax=Euplotes crassus TaxID=5936 RepID=A0AAD1XAR2_EUPCR|nr:unnamed protein product [Moneuplotes crassus]